MSKNHRRRFKKTAVSVFVVIIALLVIALAIGVASAMLKQDEPQTVSSDPSSDISSEEVPDVSLEAPVSSEEPVSSSQTTPTVVVPEGKVCYLTFDDGPSQYTEKTLSILSQYDAKATFFVVGNAVKVYPTKLQKILDQGSIIALHTYTHEWVDVYTNQENYFKDLYAIQDLVYQWTGVKTNLMRFPGGSSNTKSRSYDGGQKIMSKLTKAVEEKGFVYFDWNADSTDASGNGVAVEKLIASVKNECCSDKVCLLMHDTDMKGTTVEALPQILEYLKGQGYRFEVLSETSPTFHHGVNN